MFGSNNTTASVIELNCKLCIHVIINIKHVHFFLYSMWAEVKRVSLFHNLVNVRFYFFLAIIILLIIRHLKPSSETDKRSSPPQLKCWPLGKKQPAACWVEDYRERARLHTDDLSSSFTKLHWHCVLLQFPVCPCWLVSSWLYFITIRPDFTH